MAPGLRKLIALSLLAGLGFGLALARGDLFFLAGFGRQRNDHYRGDTAFSVRPSVRQGVAVAAGGRWGRIAPIASLVFGL
jgi:hypothetical protein